jgi:multiple sugar transport system permease protein
MLFVEDDIFVKAVGNTLGFAVVTGPVAYFVALLFAWLLNRLNAKYRYIYVMLFYAPSLLAGISVGVVWTYFLSGDRYGLINNVLLRLGILDEPYLWLTNVNTIMPAIIVVSLWMSLGTGFLAFLAGLQNVSAELYEAGSIDGIRSKWQELFLITLPSMKPQLLFGAVMQVVASFKVFDISMALAGFPSHLYAGHTILTHLYDYAFIRFEMGYAAAISVVLFFMMFGLSRFFMAVLSSKGE